jgi:DNA segregation ATPase FtsK/SpoIIIE, S-DNA-T family
MMEQHPDLEDMLVQLSREGGGLGIFLVITAHSLSAVKYKILNNIKRSLALQLADRGEYGSLVGRTSLIPPNVPGRGLCRQESVLEFQIALPAEGKSEIERASHLKANLARISQLWQGSGAESLMILPASMSAQQLQQLAEAVWDAQRHLFPIGLDVESVQPVFWPRDSSKLLVTGLSRARIRFGLQGILSALTNWAHPFDQVYLVDQSSLGSIDAYEKIPLFRSADKADEIEQMVIELDAVCQSRQRQHAAAVSQVKRLLILADINGINRLDQHIRERLEKLIRHAEDHNLFVISAGAAADFSACWDGPGKAVRENSIGLILCEPNDQQVFNLRLPYSMTAKPLKADEAYLTGHDGTNRVKLPAVNDGK